MNSLIRTLVVDDSAFTRKAVREMLSRCPAIEVVGAAHDGLEALEMVEELKPDVVTCDLMMPRLNGPGFVREQMARRPVPILIVSVAEQDAELAIEALDAGAVDFVQKPTALASDQLFGVREQLVEKVKAAASAHRDRLRPVTPPAPPTLAGTRASRVDVVTIGISTGGPQALRQLLPQLPKDFPVPLAIVLHMPVGFTALYAAKLNELCALEVQEATEGEELRPGCCLLAKAGKHLVLERTARAGVRAHLSLSPTEVLHRPSVDVLFRSAAQVYGERVLGVVMTGMGADGKEGAGWIKARGGTILTEGEASCVIYGMPRAVVEAGLSDAEVPLNQLAQAIMQRL